MRALSPCRLPTAFDAVGDDASIGDAARQHQSGSAGAARPAGRERRRARDGRGGRRAGGRERGSAPAPRGRGGPGAARRDRGEPGVLVGGHLVALDGGRGLAQTRPAVRRPRPAAASSYGRSRAPTARSGWASRPRARAGWTRRSSPRRTAGCRRPAARRRGGARARPGPAAPCRRSSRAPSGSCMTAMSTGRPPSADAKAWSASDWPTSMTEPGAGWSAGVLVRGEPRVADPDDPQPGDLEDRVVEHVAVGQPLDEVLGGHRVVVAAHPDVGHAEGPDRLERLVLGGQPVVGDVAGVDDRLHLELARHRADDVPGGRVEVDVGDQQHPDGVRRRGERGQASASRRTAWTRS